HTRLQGDWSSDVCSSDLTPYLYAAAGATIVLAPSASPGRGVAEGGDLGTAESCRLMDRFYASYLTVYVVYVNRVGHEDGIAFWEIGRASCRERVEIWGVD